jgi:hypothetical protein
MDPKRRRATAIFIALSIASPLTFPAGARASADVDAAEALARTTYHEGMPYGEARKLTDAGAARLAEMLDDPAEAQHHAQIAELLGMSGRAGAYEAIGRAAAAAPSGEVDRATLRTRVAVLAALGHLARSDDRALADLVAAAAGDGRTPTWGHGRLRGPRLAALLRRSALSGLALSGRTQAAEVLQHLLIDARRARAAPGTSDLARHLEEALRLHGRVASEGAEAVFRGDGFGGKTR